VWLQLESERDRKTSLPHSLTLSLSHSPTLILSRYHPLSLSPSRSLLLSRVHAEGGSELRLREWTRRCKPFAQTRKLTFTGPSIISCPKSPFWSAIIRISFDRTLKFHHFLPGELGKIVLELDYLTLSTGKIRKITQKLWLAINSCHVIDIHIFTLRSWTEWVSEWGSARVWEREREWKWVYYIVSCTEWESENDERLREWERESGESEARVGKWGLERVRSETTRESGRVDSERVRGYESERVRVRNREQRVRPPRKTSTHIGKLPCILLHIRQGNHIGNIHFWIERMKPSHSHREIEHRHSPRTGLKNAHCYWFYHVIFFGDGSTKISWEKTRLCVLIFPLLGVCQTFEAKTGVRIQLKTCARACVLTFSKSVARFLKNGKSFCGFFRLNRV